MFFLPLPFRSPAMVSVVPVSSAAAVVTDEFDVEQRQTLWVGGLNEKVTQEILYELFVNVSHQCFIMLLI